MKTQLYTLQNWCVWGGTFVAGPVAQAVSSSYLLRSGEPDFLPSLYKRIYTTTIRLYKSCFPCWKSTTACKAQRLWRKDCCLPGSYENLSHCYSGCENHLLRRKWSFAFLICTEKPWAPLFNALGRHVDYFQSSSTLMSWKPNKPTETHPRALKRRGMSLFSCQTVHIWSMGSPRQKSLEHFHKARPGVSGIEREPQQPPPGL